MRSNFTDHAFSHYHGSFVKDLYNRKILRHRIEEKLKKSGRLQNISIVFACDVEQTAYPLNDTKETHEHDPEVYVRESALDMLKKIYSYSKKSNPNIYTVLFEYLGGIYDITEFTSN